MPPAETRRLTARQQTALTQLLMGATITEAAQAAGVTRQTVSEWCNHHGAFQAELSERRASALKDAQQQLEEAALIAVEVLSELARDPAVPASVRVKASVAILERCGVQGVDYSDKLESP